MNILLKNKKVIVIFVFIILLFIGIIALTQELDLDIPEAKANETDELTDEFEDELDLPPRKPTRWFISNAGGMALEETESRFVAMRSEYSLVIDYPGNIKEFPERLIEYKNDKFNFEIRSLYNKGELQRTQWIFKDEKEITRINAVFVQPKDSGFIELFNEKSFLMSEFMFYEDGGKSKIEYQEKNNLIIKADFFDWDANDKKYAASYTDIYRYNRSLSLRAVERVFSKNTLLNDPLRITFPRRIMDAIKTDFLTSQRLNIVPEFFGEVFAEASTKMIFETDDRGRIISQTFYDEEEKIIWTIVNKWSNDRIVSTVKTEGETELRADYEYASNGDRIVERNFRNGKLERIVRTNNKIDTEELYYEDILVLKAVWEDGKKISEERIR
ncbi:MAG: hypothetical protein FWB73_03810 [Treponema sp.]|nr:hypothetical protein [Treponema sp.]